MKNQSKWNYQIYTGGNSNARKEENRFHVAPEAEFKAEVVTETDK